MTNKNKAKSRFLEGNYAPWRSEDEYDNLEVIGDMPRDLKGTLIRNGANPQFDPIGFYHWFEGDGMLHAIHIADGKAQYRNRWVRTERFKLEAAAGKLLFNAALSADPDPALAYVSQNTANTNIISVNQRLLALNEGASPVEIDLQTLNTIGDYTFDEKIKTRFTAHPRYDHRTKELLAYSYINEDGSLRYYRINQDDQVVAENKINWPYQAMMHDFVNTENYVIFPIFPTTMSFERMMKGESIFMWEGDQFDTYFIVTDRDGNEVTRLKTDPCFVYHFGNAYEDGDSIIIDAVRGKVCPLFPDRHGHIGTVEDAQAHLVRWTLDLKQQTVSCDSLDKLTIEFPRFDERFNGYPYRHLYAAGSDSVLYDRLVHYDLKSNQKFEHCFDNANPCEPVFVARSEKEGDGYLLTVVYRNDEDRSDVLILDAQDITADPMAIIKIPHRIPFGFHGNFV